MLTIAAGFPSLKSSFTHIDWEKIGVAFMEHFFQLVLITIIFWIINRIGKHIIRNSFQHHDPIEKQSARSQTVYAVVKNIFKYSVLFFYVYTILSNLGVPVGTLLAGAGILSVAIGLGTQGIVSDVINGLTILIEGQLRVGDSVTIQSIDEPSFQSVYEPLNFKHSMVLYITCRIAPFQQFQIILAEVKLFPSFYESVIRLKLTVLKTCCVTN